MRSTFIIVLAALAIGCFLTPARAGSPLMCHQIQIGDVKSLPWGDDVFSPASKYVASNVVEDTLKLLTPDMPVLGRMETMRRAVVYIKQDTARADRLLGSLLTRALDAEVVMDSKVVALSYFDAGYFAATLGQAGIRTSFGPQIGKHDLHRVPGYAWMVRGYKLDHLNGDMALGLALATADTRLTEHTMFLEQAVKSIAVDDAARNDLLGWVCQIRGTTVDAVRAKYAAASPAQGR
jgi:hypothetical protein